MFIGDSQVRTLYRHYDAVMTRKRVSQAKGGNISSSYPGGHTAWFLWDPYLNDLSKGLLPWAGRHDIVVFVFDAWPASFGQWTVEKYKAFTRELMMSVASVSSRTTFLWVGSPAWPKSRYGVPGFRISNTRLGLWNSISRSCVTALVVRCLDFFEVSWPHIRMHRGDGMHYDLDDNPRLG